MLRIVLLLSLSVSLTGCYYMQAASGQWEVLRKRKAVDEVIEDPDTPPAIAARLRLLAEARDFSVTDLGLPDNKSYRSYTKLERDYVVWNVFAAPEFSLTPKQWCFPIAGCVSYRGYFSKAAAIRKSQQLSGEGYDVVVGGVVAYSTLGRFNDPILSTMLQRDDVELIAVLFHELAHQVVYVKDDSTFNESFATAVEEFGIKRWSDSKGLASKGLASKGQDGSYEQYLEGREFKQQIAGIMDAARADLETIYSSDANPEIMRAQKSARLRQLHVQVRAKTEQSGRAVSGWLSGSLNNAHLIPTALYADRLPKFRAIYASCVQSMQCFYEVAKRFASMTKAERDIELSAGDLPRGSGGLDD